VIAAGLILFTMFLRDLVDGLSYVCQSKMAFVLGGAAAGAIGGAIAYKKAQREVDQLFANDDDERGDKAWEKTSAKMVRVLFVWLVLLADYLVGFARWRKTNGLNIGTKHSGKYLPL
jgi:hypothetical protein